MRQGLGRLLTVREPCFGELAVPAGFEPATPRFEVSCSIQLSYGTVFTRREGLCVRTPIARCASGRPRSFAPA